MQNLNNCANIWKRSGPVKQPLLGLNWVKRSFSPWASLIAGNSIFSGYSISLYYKSGCGHLLVQWILYFVWIFFTAFSLAAMNYLHMIQCIWQIFLLKACCYFKGELAAIYLSGNIIISGGTYNEMVFSRVLCFFETRTWS